MDGRRWVQRDMSRAAVSRGLVAGAGVARVVSDESLALRAANGDKQAFAEIFDRYHRSLYRCCLALVGNSQDAQDALQNTMIKVLRALPGEERHIKLKPWLYRIAHNESIELLRRRRETQPLDPDLAAAESGLAESAAVRERLRELISDLEMLPERQRGVLVMRELAGLDFAEIGIALGTSAAVVRQTLYEARLSLRQMDEGREMSCEAVAKALSDGDGRVARRRGLRAHLRTCANCRHFGREIESRERDFAALAPLPPAAAAGLLQGLLGGHGAGGGGLAGTLGGGAAQSLGASAALKGAATVAVVAVIGVGTASRGGLVDAGQPDGSHPRATQARQPVGSGASRATSPTRSGPAASDAGAGSVAGTRHARHLDASQTTKPGRGPAPDDSVTPGDTATPADTAKPGAGQTTTSGSAESGSAPAAQESPVAHPHGKGHEKQLPSASEHGQQTAASHKGANQGQETAAGHKATEHGSAAQGHPAPPSKPPHPAQPSSPGAEGESSPPPSNPSVPESNGNAKGKGNGKGASPAAGTEGTAPGPETGREP
jgi:RNA polymerase sigma factor (sigma-70 family)